MLARRPEIAHRRKPLDEMIDPRFPILDRRRKRQDQTASLLDNWRDEQREQSEYSDDCPYYGQEKREPRRNMKSFDKKIPDRAEEQRDDDGQEEKQKNSGRSSHQPEAKHGENYCR